jgi:hypothetical protein
MHIQISIRERERSKKEARRTSMRERERSFLRARRISKRVKGRVSLARGALDHLSGA